MASVREVQAKEQKTAELRKRVFEVATKLIEEVGYENLTIRDICTAAGISTGMFYRNFKSKDELFVAYYDQVVEQFNNEVVERLKGFSTEEKLIRFEVWLSEFTANCGLDFAKNLYTSTNILMNTDVVHNRVMDITDGIIGEAVENGLVLSGGRKTHDVSQDMCLISKGIIFDWCSHDGSYDIGKRTEDLFRRVIGGLL